MQNCRNIISTELNTLKREMKTKNKIENKLTNLSSDIKMQINFFFRDCFWGIF